MTPGPWDLRRVLALLATILFVAAIFLPEYPLLLIGLALLAAAHWA